MSEGLPEGLEPSLLEVPTTTLSIVFIFFLVVSLGFEWGLHALKSTLRRRGREGLALATGKVASELTVLGFVSLVLLLFQSYVPDICITPTTTEFTLLSNIDGCPCCLQNTNDVTSCAQISRNCAFNVTSKEPYCGCPEAKASVANETAGAVCGSYLAAEARFILDEVVEGIPWASKVANINLTAACDVLVNKTLAAEAAPAGSVQAVLEAQMTPPPSPQEVVAGAPEPSQADAEPGDKRRRSLQHHSEIDSIRRTSSNLLSYQPNLGGASARRLRRLEEEATGGHSGATKPSEGEIIVEVEDESEYLAPQLTRFRCQGEFIAGSCPPGKKIAISSEALDQVHILIFLVAVFHVLASVICVLMASLRMRQWRRWQREDTYVFEMALSGLPTAAASLDYEAAFPSQDLTTEQHGEQMQQSLALSMPSSALDGAEPSVFIEPPVFVASTEKLIAEGGGAGSGGGSAPKGEGEEGDGNEAANDVEKSSPSVAQNVRQYWQRRNSRIVLHRHRLAEAAICVGQALLPNLVSRTEFGIMRKAYLATLRLPPTFDFVTECELFLDFDLARIVGLSFGTWCIFITMVLLTGLYAATPAWFMLGAAIELLIINIMLVATIRYSCRGGRPHKLKDSKKWYRNPRTLAIPLGGSIFFFSLSFSMMMFFGWQFGPHSCFFTKAHRPWTFVPQDMPWWTANVSSIILIMWVANVTVPAWALVTHTIPITATDEDESQAGPKRQFSLNRRRRGQGELLKEINRLQSELQELQED